MSDGSKNMTVVILAAGLGTRMRSKRAKVLHRAGGLTLVEHVVAAAGAVAPAGGVPARRHPSRLVHGMRV